MSKFIAKNFLPLILLAFTFFSCSNDDDNAKVTPVTTAAKGCILLEWNDQNGSNFNQTIFNYNSQNRIVNLKPKTNGVPDSASFTVDYNAAGQISRYTYWHGTTQKTYEQYTYNSDNLLTKKETFSHNAVAVIPVYIYTYVYDANKKLIKRNVYAATAPTVLISYIDYTYPTSNTALAQGYYDEDGNGTLDHTSNEEYTFDNKKSVQQLIGVIWDDEFISPNNATKQVYTSIGSTPFTATYTFTYDYNAEGYPTKITGSNGTSTNITNLVYNCN
jgi:hypothetical protein